MSNPRGRGTRSHDWAPPSYTAADLPAPSVNGRIIHRRDYDGLWRDNGTSWNRLDGLRSPSLYDYYDADPSGNNDSAAAIRRMITELNANSFGAGIRGGQGYIPPGRWIVGSTITISSDTQNVALIGADTQGGTATPRASVFRGTDATVPVFDLGNNVTNHFKFKNLAIIGASGTNLAHRGITAADMDNFVLDNVFFTGFGGSALYIGAGVATTLHNVFVTGCMNGHASLADYGGVLDIRTGETFFYDGNINGPSGDFGQVVTDGSDDHLGETGGGVVGSGFLCGLYFANNLLHMYHVTLAFCHYGLKTSSLGIAHNIENCRFEFNQRHGLWQEGIKGRFSNNRFQDNSQEGDGLYEHIKIGGSTNGYGNVWVNNRFDAINYSDYKPDYAYLIAAGAGTTWEGRNEFIGNAGDGFNLALYNRTGSQHAVIAPTSFDQQVSKSTDAQTAEFNAQAGDIWRLHLTSAAANVTIGVPLYPIENKQVVLEIFNQTGGALTSVTFNAVFKVATLTLPANGKRRTTRLYYDGTNWFQIGDWSGDL